MFCFHFQKLPRRVRRANLLGSGRRDDLVSPNRSRGAARRNELNFVHGLRGLTQISFASSWFPDSFRTCHSSLVAGTMPTMKTFTPLITILFAALIATPSFAQAPATSPAAASTLSATQPTSATGQPPNPQEMMKQMVEMSKLNENHNLLADMNGSWNYTIKMWMNPDPNAQPQQSKGTATRKSAMGGRYFVMDVTGKLQMAGEDGKMKDMQFKGMAVEGYDNMKKKFVSSWIDNMGTAIQYSVAPYD